MNLTQEVKSINIVIKQSKTDGLIALSDVCLAEGRYEEACSSLNEALLLGERVLEIYNRFGYIKYCKQEYQAALECYGLATDMCIDDADLNNNLGLLYWAMGELELAEKYFTKARGNLKPHREASLNLARLALARENYKTGWEQYCFFRETQNPDDLLPINFVGKSVLIYGQLNSWQALFFLRFLPALGKIGAKKISYYSHEDFSVLFKNGIEGITILRVLPVETQYDVILPIAELPGILSKTQSLSFLKPVSFGHPSRSNLKVVKNLLPNNGRENIAVSWESFNSESSGLKMRVSPELLGESLQYSNANILVFQKQPKSNDIRLLEKGLRRKVFNYGFMSESLDDAYAFLNEIDHYISIGDHNVHLASSQNIKVSVMLSHPPQWQWLLDGKETPWFPGFNLYRQDISGSWEQACQALSLTLYD